MALDVDKIIYQLTSPEGKYDLLCLIKVISQKVIKYVSIYIHVVLIMNCSHVVCHFFSSAFKKSEENKF